jgi:hypothetical protein
MSRASLLVRASFAPVGNKAAVLEERAGLQ